MPPLSPDLIKQLLAQPARKPKGKGPKVDANDRSYQTWFKLHPTAFGEGGPGSDDRPQCSNENCSDERPPHKTAMGELVKVQFTLEVNGLRMCRRCFMSGYGLAPSSAQTQLPTQLPT